MLVVVYLDRRVDAQRERHFFRLAVRAMNDQRDILARLDAFSQGR